jgi:5-methylcytosine-specific restriction endonuclease McrA
MRHGRPDQRWCSKSCAQAWRSGARPPYERNVLTGMARKLALAKAMSRARRLRHAQTWDGITDEQILERDRWRCGICRKVIGKSFSYPHPRSKSIDHIIPLSEGGDDTAANKRAAHLSCNLSRGNRGGNEQAALFG